MSNKHTHRVIRVKKRAESCADVRFLWFLSRSLRLSGAVKAEPGCTVCFTVSLLQSSHTDWRDVAPLTADL